MRERRKTPRVRLSQPVRIRLDSDYPGEVCTASNISRNGLYVETSSAHYFAGMHVNVTRNFQPADLTNREETSSVVRVDKLNDGGWGVAIRILRSTALASSRKMKTTPLA